MSALESDFTDCTVFIYNNNGVHLISTTITNHERASKQIQVSVMPEGLKVNDDCMLLILSTPTPCEYHGKVKKVGGNQYFAMFQGQEKESRTSKRYPVNTHAQIDALIVDDRPYSLQTPLEVVLINISTTGVRFRAPFYSLEKGDHFHMHFTISNNKKQLTAQVVNFTDNKTESSDYGCRFQEIDNTI